MSTPPLRPSEVYIVPFFVFTRERGVDRLFCALHVFVLDTYEVRSVKAAGRQAAVVRSPAGGLGASTLRVPPPSPRLPTEYLYPSACVG